MSKLDIAELLINYRKENDYSVAKIAKLVGVKEKTVLKWENGRRVPTRVELNVLSNLYDIDVHDFIKGQEQTYKRKLMIQRYKYITLLIFIGLLGFLNLPTLKEVRLYSMRGECSKPAEYISEVENDVLILTAKEFYTMELNRDEFYCVPFETKINVPIDELIKGQLISEYLEFDISDDFRQAVKLAKVEETEEMTIKVSFVIIYDNDYDNHRSLLNYFYNVSDSVN